MFSSFFIPFVTILAAEFLDKSQLSVLLLATKTRKHLQLFLGVMLAFLVVDGLAIVLGEFLTTLLPKTYLTAISGLLFIIFGILSLKSSTDNETTKAKLTSPFISGFSLVFFSEMGDKTQLAAAVFATHYNPFFVFAGVMSALALLSLLAIVLSKQLTRLFKADHIRHVSGIIFIILGLIFFYSLLPT